MDPCPDGSACSAWTAQLRVHLILIQWIFLFRSIGNNIDRVRLRRIGLSAPNRNKLFSSLHCPANPDRTSIDTHQDSPPTSRVESGLNPPKPGNRSLFCSKAPLSGNNNSLSIFSSIRSSLIGATTTTLFGIAVFQLLRLGRYNNNQPESLSLYHSFRKEQHRLIQVILRPSLDSVRTTSTHSDCVTSVALVGMNSANEFRSTLTESFPLEGTTTTTHPHSTDRPCSALKILDQNHCVSFLRIGPVWSGPVSPEQR